MGKVIFVSASGEQYFAEISSGMSVMQAATSQGIPGVDAECGGALACATCHVYVDPEWRERLPAPEDPELMMLDFAAAPADNNSRLSCQIEYTEELDGLTVQLPEVQ